MNDLLERLQALIADGIKGLENAQAEIAKRDATIATLTRRVEELEGAWRPITDHPDHPRDVMFYRAEAEWISAKTLDVMPGMPDRERFEIGYWEDNAWHYACSNHEVFEFGDKPGDNLQDPTHWRPLPTPPKGEYHG